MPFVFGVSIDEELLASFDDLVDRGNYDNRSEAVWDMIRERLVKRQRGDGEKVEQIASNLISCNGVKHGEITAASTGKELV